MRPLPNDVTRCPGEECEERETCMRYLSCALDPEDGVHSYSFFDHKNCNNKINVKDYEKTN
jgi:hypothetical protein